MMITNYLSCVSNNKYLYSLSFTLLTLKAKRNAKNEQFNNVCGQIFIQIYRLDTWNFFKLKMLWIYLFI